MKKEGNLTHLRRRYGVAMSSGMAGHQDCMITSRSLILLPSPPPHFLGSLSVFTAKYGLSSCDVGMGQDEDGTHWPWPNQ